MLMLIVQPWFLLLEAAMGALASELLLSVKKCSPSTSPAGCATCRPGIAASLAANFSLFGYSIGPKIGIDFRKA